MKQILKRLAGWGTAGLLVLGLAAISQTATAQSSVYKGKKVIFEPISMGLTLTEAWARGMQRQADLLGFSFEIRDGGFDIKAMSQIFAKAINDKPAVIVINNPTVQLLSRQIRQAEKAGIGVLQINLQSNQISTAFVGANWTLIGTQVAEDIVKQCGQGSGRSGKVAIIPGQLTAADSIVMNDAAFAIFKKHPEIKVVSNQASNWEPEKARQITATVLQQNPDLCAIFGHWGVHTIGAGNAVKDAGKSDDVTVYATGGGNRLICNAIENGIIDRYWSYNADGQGRDLGTMVRLMLQGAKAPEGAMMTVDSPLIVIKRATYSPSQCWDM